MVGVSDVWWVYQNSGPAMLFLMLVGATILWRTEIQPRFQDLEETQQARKDRWQDRDIEDREQTLLLDDAHNRVDEHDEAIGRLKKRLRMIEQKLAAETGDHFTRAGSDSRSPDELKDRLAEMDDDAGAGADGADDPPDDLT